MSNDELLGHNGPRIERAGRIVEVYIALTYLDPRMVEGDERTVASDLVADLLHWVAAHDVEPDDLWDLATLHYYAEVEEAASIDNEDID